MSSKELKSIKSCIWLSEGWWLHTMDIIHGQYDEVTACYINLRCNLKVWQWVRMCASLVFSPQLVEELDFLWYLIWHIQNKLHLWKTFVLLNATVCFFVGFEETDTLYICFFFTLWIVQWLGLMNCKWQSRGLSEFESVKLHTLSLHLQLSSALMELLKGVLFHQQWTNVHFNICSQQSVEKTHLMKDYFNWSSKYLHIQCSN